MSIKTVEIKELEAKAANVYEAIVVLSKRSRQINDERKLEFNQRIETITALTVEEEEIEPVNPDQLKISLEFENRPKPTEQALQELMTDKIEFHYKEEDVK